MTDTAGFHDAPRLIVTAVGSLPHSRVDEASDLVFRSLQTAPHATQLPRADARELMWVQYGERLPCFNADLQNQKYWFDTSGDYTAELERFYTEYLPVADGARADYFAVSPEYGRGIHDFLQRVRAAGRKFPILKAQVTGPLSFALTIPDEKDTPIFYHTDFRDAAVKGLAAKAAWLTEQLLPHTENAVIFIDEPSMSAYGSSAYLGVSRNDVIESINEVAAIISQRGGIPGVHCCGNTDYGLLMDTDVRILNFDAVDYLAPLGLYMPQLNAFLERGGTLAWGAVPNDERAATETVDDVVNRIRNGLRTIEAQGASGALLRSRMMLTPACGCASLSITDAEKVYALLCALDQAGERILD